MRKTRPLVFLFLSLGFLLLGVIAEVFFDTPTSEKVLAAGISGAVQQELARADRTALDLLKPAADNSAWQETHDSFFLIDSLTVLKWTSNDFLPDLRSLHDEFTVRLLQVTQGEFLVRKWNLQDKKSLLYVLPLHNDYKIVNNYLTPTWNSTLFKTSVEIDDPTGLGENVFLADGRCVFKIRRLVVSSGDGALDPVGLLATTLSVICFLIFVGLTVRELHQQRRYAMAFLGLMVSLIALRIVMVRFNFPNAFSDLPLFDPHRFASSSFNASMGDLLLNSISIIALCMYLFFNYPKMKGVSQLLKAKPSHRLLASTVGLLICFFSLLYPFLFIEIIYHNSAISLEITDSLSFDGIRWTAFISLLAGCISSFLFIHVFFRIALLLTRRNGGRFWIAMAVSAGAFLVFFLANGKDYWITLGVGLVYFMFLYVFRIAQQFNRFTFNTFLYFMVVIITLSAEGALSVRKFNEERRVRDQFRFGDKFLVDQDVLGEFLLNESAQQIGADHFIQMNMLNPFLSKTSILQKVRQSHLNSYFDRYDIRVYLFDVGGKPYAPQAVGTFSSLIKNYQEDANKTAYSGIYFINTPTTEATKQYLVIIPVKHHTLSVGFIVLNLKLKKVIPRSVFPELLVDNRFSHYFKSKEFSYAFYSKGVLSNSFGEFNYEKEFDKTELENPLLYTEGIFDSNFDHIGIEDRNGQAAIVSAKVYPLFSVVTNFAFFFILGLVVVLNVLFVTGAVTWLTGGRLDYAARIQLYVYLAFFLPLLTVSITTLSLTSRTAEDQLRREYDERSQTLGEKMSKPLMELQTDPVNNRSENEISELAKLADLDASVYGNDGVLIASSQPLIFENRLTSTLINRNAFEAIVRDKGTSYIANERIGKLYYNCSYVAIKSAESGTELGVLSIPFFGSAQSLEKIQINVLANILSVFVLVFILFSIISFVIADGLTFPLRFITKSLKKTTLTDKNQLILWNSNDEIGLLANEYNRMIKNLEQSRIELARVQKETAWREIAKQVAHEIKNPLTPMKLTLQQMELALGKKELSPEKSQKAIETLLAQLDILNEIATSFSTFARMPAPELERIDLDALLKNVVALHQTYPEGTVTLRLGKGPTFVSGNAQLLGRVFGNIILNALQSGKEGRKVAVTISTLVTGEKCLVHLQDDGRGIDPEIQDKVFLPHFSTKRTGSGLGLAIAKQGIEQTGGRIWFETSPALGTTFFVELVLAR